MTTETSSPSKKALYLPLFKIPAFTILLAGRIVSSFGQILFSMVTMWYVLDLTDSAFAAALIPLVPFVTYLFLGIPLATLSDRFNKKKVLIYTDLARVLIVVGVIFLFATDQVTAGYIYVANLLLAIVGFMFNPAIQTVLPSILPHPDQQLAPANAILNSSIRTIDIGGYAIGGIFIAAFDTTFNLAFYCIAFLLSALTILLIRIPDVRAEKRKGITGFWKDSIQGVQFILSKRILRYIVGFGALINLFGAPLHIFTPIFSRVVLEAGSEGYGLLQTAFAVGGVVGALISGKYSKKLKLWQWFFVSYILAGLCQFMMPLLPYLWICVVLSFLLMMALALVNVPLISTLILATPEELRGRVMTSFGVLGSGISVPIGLLVGGSVMDWFSPQIVYIFIGVMTCLMGVLSSLLSAFKDESELTPVSQSKNIVEAL